LSHTKPYRTVSYFFNTCFDIVLPSLSGFFNSGFPTEILKARYVLHAAAYLIFLNFVTAKDTIRSREQPLKKTQEIYHRLWWRTFIKA